MKQVLFHAISEKSVNLLLNFQALDEAQMRHKFKPLIMNWLTAKINWHLLCSYRV